MARKKSRKKKRAAKVAAKGRSVSVKEPGYMVQIPEPALIRRDVLESLREVILFMQSYEKFKRVQEEKKTYISELKLDLKELSNLINSKMKFYFPIGKLTAIGEELDDSEDLEAEEEEPRRSSVRAAAPKPIEHSDLDELETQLRDIESQLQGIQ